MSESRDHEPRNSISVGVSLDEDGFLLRECPACEMEFRWHVSTDEDAELPDSEGGLFCPYCGKQASPESWFTKAQADFLAATALHEVRPQIDEMLGGLARDSDWLKVEVTGTVSGEKPAALEETFDPETRRVDFPCHPTEPVKVALNWEHPVHCLVCGQAE